MPDLVGGDPIDPEALAAMLEQVWRDKGLPPGLINPEVTRAFAEKLWGAVVEGYGTDLPGVDFDTPDHTMLAKLQENVWHFSGAKNYQQLKELSAALIGPDGKLRSRNDFIQEALKINDTQIKQYLSAEYDLAVIGGQMAAKWVRIEANRETFPLLEFDVVLDSRTTTICRPLAGVIVPYDSPFVKKYYPPNHYNCRTTVRQLRSGVVTKKPQAPDVPKMFRTNIAQQGLVFPKDHPYFKDIPASVLKKASALKKAE